MRWLVSGTLLALGAVLLFLFAGGAFISMSAGLPGEDPWDSALGPLWKLTPLGMAVLFCGGACVVFGVGSLLPEPRPDRRGRIVSGWSRAAQAAFNLNVLIGAVLVLALSLALRNTAPAGTVGHVYLLAIFTMVVGSFLAFVLFRLEKRRLLYASALTLHLVEMGSLVTVFIMGLGG